MVPQTEDSGLVEDFIITLASLSATSSPGIIYVSFTRESPDVYNIASFQCTLKYLSKEVDPSTGVPEDEGYEDEYQIEEVELSAGGDYIIPSYASFGSEWDRLQSAPNATETFSLSSMESLKGALNHREIKIMFILTCQKPLATPSSKYSTWKHSAVLKFRRLHRCTLFSCRDWLRAVEARSLFAAG